MPAHRATLPSPGCPRESTQAWRSQTRAGVGPHRVRACQPGSVGARVAGACRCVCVTARAWHGVRAPGCACQRGCARECARVGAPGAGGARALGRAPRARLCAPAAPTQPRRVGDDFVTSTSSPVPRPVPAPERCRKLPPPLWTRLSKALRAGAAADRSSGSLAAQAPQCGGSGRAGKATRSGQRGRSCPDARHELVGGSGELGPACRGVRSLGRRAPGSAEVPATPASPLPAPPPGDPEPPGCGAPGQTPPRAEDLSGREAERKEVASSRQGILNYRLKASKTVHHIFHVSADCRDKRKQNAGGLRGGPLSAPHPLTMCANVKCIR